MSGLRWTIAVILCGCLAACGQTATLPTTASNEADEKAAVRDRKRLVIGFSQCNAAEPYRATQISIMKREIANYPDCELIVQDAQQRNETQVAQIESFINQKIDALIIAPNEAAPLTPVARQAKEAGIKVVCLERNLLEPAYDIFVGADNVKIGELAGRFIVEKLTGVEKPVIVEVRGLQGTKPEQERYEGAHKYMDTLPNVRVVEVVADWLQERAKKQMETILQKEPKIDVVYAHNDPMAVGCYIAAEEVGRQDEMVFVGVDGLGGPEGGIKKVMDGVLDCTFIYPTCAAEGLSYAVQLARGEAVPKEVILDPYQVTPENAQEWYGKATEEDR